MSNERNRTPDLAGQIVSLKDHLRLADARLDAADGLLRRIVEQWDENEVGMLDGEVIEEARAHLDGAAIKSPITDAAIDAAVAAAKPTGLHVFTADDERVRDRSDARRRRSRLP